MAPSYSLAMQPARIHVRDERAMLASFEGGLVLIVLRTRTYDVRDEIAALLDEVSSENEGIYCVMVRRGEIPRQKPGPTRSWAKQVLGRHKDAIRGVAYVYLGGWFGRAMASSVMTGLSAVLRTPVKLHTSEAEAVDWIASLDGAPASFAESRADILEALARG